MLPVLQRLLWRRDEVVAAPTQLPPAVAARADAWLFGIGALLAAAIPLLPGRQVERPLLLVLPVVLAVAITPALAVTYDRTPPGVLRALPALGTLMVGAAMLAVTPETRPAYAVLLFWAVLAACFFRDVAAADLLLVVVVLGACLAQGRADGWEALWLGGSVTLTGFGVMLALLRRRADTLLVALDAAARTDALTGLLNRRGLEEALDEELERARRTDRCCSLLLVDLDAFKARNDAHGHAAGDAALVRVAAALRSHRRGDRCGRIGGDEFVVVLAETDVEGATRSAERVLLELEDVPLSIGVACYPAHARDAAGLREAADRALYAAKAAGGGRVAVFAGQEQR